MEDPYSRKVQTSVTCFLYCGDDYLFLRRNISKRIDPGKVNGVGGRLEKGEDYLTAALREIQEETGYILVKEALTFSGIIKLQEGLEEDWVLCCFKAEVPTKNIPIGTHTDDGELFWVHKDNMASVQDDFVDDINYCMEDIIEEKNIFFLTALLDEQLKVKSMSKVYLSR
jgi:8-oxo-dGTP diphosphatase